LPTAERRRRGGGIVVCAAVLGADPSYPA